MNFDPTAIPDLIGRFHPLMLHFPIGLLMWAAVVELVEVIKRRRISSAGPVRLPCSPRSAVGGWQTRRILTRHWPGTAGSGSAPPCWHF